MKNLAILQSIEQKIYLIRGQKIMIDADLAALYGVEARTLNQAVKRNKKRFPADFMFKLNDDENNFLRSQNVISNIGRGGRRYLPYAFTEHGILMLSSILNSNKAIQVNIQIMRTFIKLRNILAEHNDILRKIEKMEKGYDRQFRIVFDIIRELNNPIDKKRKQIGFKIDKDK